MAGSLTALPSPHTTLGLYQWFSGGIPDLLSPPRGNVPILDTLRTLAIALVFCRHFAGTFQASPLVSKFPMFYWGWSGVDLFFVLSGLLIGAQLWKELQRTGTLNVGRFLLRRGLRIWPLYFSFVALLFVESLLGGRDGSQLWADMVCLSNYFGHQLGGGWSLSTEEQFYLFSPLLILLLAMTFRQRRLWVIGFAAGIPIVARTLQASTSILNSHDLRSNLYFPFHTHCDGLIIGLLLAWFWVYRPDLIRSRRWCGWAAATMVCTGVGLYAANRIVFNFTALSLVFGAAALYGIGLPATPRIVRWRGFYVISRLSFGIYLNHFGLLDHLGKFFSPWRIKEGEPAFWFLLLVSFALSVVISLITFQLIEWPFLALRSRWLHSTSTASPGSAFAMR